MKRILLIEDEPIAARLIQSLLPHAGPEEFTTDLAAQLGTALTRLDRASFDAILLDLDLPDSQGLGTLHAVRAAAPDIPIVVLSNLDDEGVATQALQAGAQDYVDKARLDAPVLRRILCCAVERHRSTADWQTQRAAAQQALAAREQMEAAWRAALDELRQLAAFQQGLLENMEAPVFSVDRQYRYTSFNRRHAEVMQRLYGAQIAVGQNMLDYMTVDEDRTEARRNLERALRGEAFTQAACLGEEQRRRSYFEMAHSPVQDAEGQIIGVAVIAYQDETARSQAENMLRASEQKYHSLFNASLDATLLTAPEGKVFSANPAACRLFGYTEEEFARLGRGAMVDTRDPRLAPALEERAQTGHYRGELTFVRKDGTTFPGEISSALFQDQDGQVITCTVIRDMTGRKRAEEEIRGHAARAEARARSAARLNAQLDFPTTLHTICEETARALNTPIAVVDLYDDQHRALRYAADVGLPADLRGYALPIPTKAQDAPHTLANSQTNLLLALAFPSSASIPLYCDEQWLGALTVLAGSAERQFTADELALLQELGNQATQAILNARLYEQVREGHEQLQLISRQLVTTQEAERRALSQELHDEIGQNLTGLSLNLNILRSQLPPQTTPALRQRLDDSLILVRDTIQRVRNVMVELRPPALDDYGLLAALRWHGEQVAARARLTVLVEGTESVPRLPLLVETALFRVAQEALTNVVKHARATRAVIRLEANPHLIRLNIIDDGVGFDLATPRKPSGQSGWGLTSMRERSLAAGGHLRVESAPGHGTRITVEVSL